MDNQNAVNLGPVDKIPSGQGQCFEIGKNKIAVFRSRSGLISAINNRCPHRNGPLCEGIADEQHVICPYHGHKFDLKSGVGSDSGEKVSVYKVWEENGELFLKL